jgi:transketolase
MADNSLRQAYGETLVECGKQDKRIVVLEADLGKSTMSCLFQNEFPERYFEMGIAEANMASFAAGLSLTGKVAFINSFAVFTTGRNFDQIRQSICTAQLNVKINGSSAGLSDFGDGATHQSVEDIAIMRALPNMTVLCPMDSIETRQIVKAAIEHQGPVYIRIPRSNLPDLYPAGEKFEIGKPCVVRDGKDITIFAMGVMVREACYAAEMLEEKGISTKVVNVSTLKPIADESIIKHAEGMKAVITAEEHSIIGGLASVVTFALRGRAIPIDNLAIMDRFGQSAHNHEDLLEHYELNKTAIYNKACKLLKL